MVWGNMKDNKTRVVIIGAGPAGLTAAYELSKNSQYDVTVLEADSVVGGISRTVRCNHNYMDMGGHRFFSKNDRIMEFWKNILPLQGKDSFDDAKLHRKKELSDTEIDPNIEDNVMLIRNRVSRLYYDKKFFDYPVRLSKEMLYNLGLFRIIRVGFSYLKALLFPLKEDNLENFYINRFGKSIYSMFFENYTEKLWMCHPSCIDASWGAQRVKGLSIRSILANIFFKKEGKEKETSLIESFWYPKYGPGQMYQMLYEKVLQNQGKVLLQHQVTKLYKNGNSIVGLECIHNGKVVRIDGDIFISSMPIADLISAMQDKDMDCIVHSIAKELPYLDFQTVGVLCKKLKLKNTTKIKTLGNIVPDCWIYIHEPNVKMLRIQIFNNWSPYMVEDAGHTVWLGVEYTCKENDTYWNMTDEDFCQFAVDELIRIGIIDKEDVLYTHREKIKKAYPAYFGTYNQIDKVIGYLKTIPNLYCVGRNGQHRYNNMDHSMLTALETVDCIQNHKTDRDYIWKVNTEQEYHEEK